MDAIKELQKQLAAAQEVSNAKRISERNCIDLVTKLIQTERVKLVHTSSGKEWLTLEQLDLEIGDTLAANGGRINVTEIPHEVGVAVEHCEARVELMRKKDSSLSRVHGDLLTSHYLQGVAQEVEESLEEAGFMAVSDLATKYNLPADFIRERLLDLISAGSLPHVVKQNTIYTGAHASRVQARVRGALRGCTQPVALGTLAARHRLEVDMVTAAVLQCLKDGSVQGRLQGSTFTPKSYSDGQSTQVDSFFAANGYLPLTMAKNAGISAKDWAKEKQLEGVTLSSAFVASHLVDSAHASIAEALASGSWADARPLLPAPLTLADARDLLQHLIARRRLPAGAVVMDHVAMSQAFLKDVAAQLEDEVKAAAERSSCPSAPSRAAKKAAGGAADDEPAGRKSGRRGGAKGKKAKGDDDEDESRGAGAGAGAGEVVDGQVVRDVLLDQYPEVPFEVHGELCERLQPVLATMLAEASAALRSSLQSRQKVTFDQTEKFVQERYEQLALGMRALESTKLSDSPLRAYLLREVAVEALHRLLALRWEEVAGASLEVTAANRREIADKLVAKQGAKDMDSLAKLAAALARAKEDKEVAKDAAKDAATASKKGKPPANNADDDDEEVQAASAAVLDLLHAAAGDCHIFCRKVDKKREKAVATAQRAAVRAQLRDEALSDAAQICRLGLRAALAADASAAGLCFPAELWALRLVAQSLGANTVREEAVSLCQAMEAEGADPVALEAAVAAWRARALGGTSDKPAS